MNRAMHENVTNIFVIVPVWADIPRHAIVQSTMNSGQRPDVGAGERLPASHMP